MSCSKMIATKLGGVGDKFATGSRHPRWFCEEFCRIKFLNMFKIFATTLRHLATHARKLRITGDCFETALRATRDVCRKTVAVQWDRGLRALWEWYNIVHWTYQIQNQDVNTRYLGSHPPFRMVSKYLYSVITASYHLLCLLLWVGQLYLRFSIPYMIYIAIHKVLTYFIQYGANLKYKFPIFSLILKKVSMIVFNTIYICYKFQSLSIFDIYLLSAFLLSWSI